MIKGISNFSAIMYVDDQRVNSVALTGLRCVKKSYEINSFIIFGFGLIEKTSKPKFLRFSIFCSPNDVIPSGSAFTKRQRKPSLSLAVTACLVLSLPPLTPITQS